MVEVEVVCGRADAGVRAAALAHAGDLPAAVALLVDHDRTAEAARLLDRHVVRLTSQARYDDVIRAADALPVWHHTLGTRVAGLDARRHQVGVTMPELEAMLAETVRAGRPDLAAWAAAVRVEHLLLEGDPLAVVLAARHLAALPDDPLPSGVLLQARGRLRRVAALGRGAAEQAASRLATADFLRAGWETERWVSVSLFHLSYVSRTWSSPPAVTRALVEARDQLLTIDSSQVPFARFALLQAAWVRGDVPALRAELTALRRSPTGFRPATLRHVAEHLDALVELAWEDGGATALDRLERAAQGVRHVHPALTGAMLLRTTQTLLDAGRVAEAWHWSRRVAATASPGPQDGFEREVVAGRLALLTGAGADAGDDAGPRLAAALDGLAGVAHPRVTGGLALRAAQSAARAGRPGLATRLRERAERLLPADERGGWEHYWALTPLTALTTPDDRSPATTRARTTVTRR